jgi:hypothetical protein
LSKYQSKKFLKLLAELAENAQSFVEQVEPVVARIPHRDGARASLRKVTP